MKYKVPFVNYSLQYENLEKEIDSALKNVFQRGDLILRRDVEEFEKNLADFVGVKHAVSLNSGTDALYFSLIAAGLGKGDEVITVSHTFIASISAIVQAGAKPVLVDVGEDFLMDMDKVEKALTKKTKAIIPVHLNGRICDMKRLMKIAQKRNLIVIEDAAQALGAKINQGPKKGKEANWKKAGSIGLSGCFSFYPAKILGCFGDGGAVTTNNKEIAGKIRLLRDHGQKTKTRISCYGWNSRLDNLQAAVLNVKFKYLPEWLKKRREIAEIYQSGLKDVNEVELPPFDFPLSKRGSYCEDGPRNSFDVFQNYVIRARQRDKLYQRLKDRGVETLIKDPIPNHFQKELGLFNFKLPFTERLSKEVLSLPIYPELTDGQIDYTINSLKEFYKSFEK